MRTYIDESGNFKPEAAASRVCCEAALAIPEAFAQELLDRFVKLRQTWTDAPEVKGSSLNDDQTAAVLKLLGEYDVLATIVAFDVGMHTAAQIDKFQQGQAQGIVAGITPEANENVRQWATQLRDAWLAQPHQLMAQMYVLVLTLGEVIKHVPNYYAQRLPRELGRFDWVLDPKDIQPTPFEECWSKIVFPLLQVMSIDDPWMRIDGGPFDYSAFQCFDRDIPEYLLPHLKGPLPADGKSVDLGKLIREHLSFPDSKNEPGLQLADIVGSAFTKSMNGKLPPEVFRLFGSIMTQPPHGDPPVRMIALGEGPKTPLSDYHTYVLGAIKRRAKPYFIE